MIGETMINVKTSRDRTCISTFLAGVFLLVRNLAPVVVGVIIAMVFFARRVAHLAKVERSLSGEGETQTAYYTVTGALFFASSNDMMTQFEYADDPE